MADSSWRGGDLEAVGLFAAHDAVDPAGEFRLLGVADPVRRWNDDLVARVKDGHERHVKAMLAAGAGRDLVGLVGQAVFAV